MEEQNILQTEKAANKDLRMLFASFKTTEDFNNISPDGKSAEIEIAFPGDAELGSFLDKMRSETELATNVEILYESPKLGKWFEAGYESCFNHMPFVDLRVTKQIWHSFIEFYRDYIYENNYVSAPRK